MSGAANNPYFETSRDDLLRIMTAPNAGAHNAVYRGKALGSEVTDAQWATIAAGSFNDIYIGDYWTKDGVNYRLAAFDYFLNCGDNNFTKHHVVVVPDTSLYEAQMNTSDTATSGYAGSAMYKSNLEQAKTIIKTAFGPAHVLTKRELLTDTIDFNTPTNYTWFNSDVELMNEVQTYGSVAWGTYTANAYNVGSGNGQFPLFMFDHSKLCIRESYWLRAITSTASFAIVSVNGNAGGDYASKSYGVRPYFCIG